MKSKSQQSNKPEGWINSGWKVPIHLTCEAGEISLGVTMGVARFAYTFSFIHASVPSPESVEMGYSVNDTAERLLMTCIA